MEIFRWLLKWSILQVYFKYTGSILPKYIWSILLVYLKYTSNILEVHFQYTSTYQIQEEEEEYFKSTLFQQKKYIQSIYCEFNHHSNVKLNYSSNILQSYFQEVYFTYTLKILQLYFRSIVQVYFTKKSWPFFRIHLSQWTTLWKEFTCLKIAQSQFATKSPEMRDTHQIDIQRMKGWCSFSAFLWFWTWELWFAKLH